MLNTTAYSADTSALFSSLKYRPSLVFFYRSDCTLCKTELEALPHYRKELTHWGLAVVSLSTPDQKLINYLAQQKMQLIDLSLSQGGALLPLLGDTQMSLPFAVALNPNPVPADEICARWIGLLGEGKLNEWKQTCSH